MLKKTIIIFLMLMCFATIGFAEELLSSSQCYMNRMDEYRAWGYPKNYTPQLLDAPGSGVLMDKVVPITLHEEDYVQGNADHYMYIALDPDDGSSVMWAQLYVITEQNKYAYKQGIHTPVHKKTGIDSEWHKFQPGDNVMLPCVEQSGAIDLLRKSINIKKMDPKEMGLVWFYSDANDSYYYDPATVKPNVKKNEVETVYYQWRWKSGEYDAYKVALQYNKQYVSPKVRDVYKILGGNKIATYKTQSGVLGKQLLGAIGMDKGNSKTSTTQVLKGCAFNSDAATAKLAETMQAKLK